MTACVPHPFPYQGSKRAIAHRILACFPDTVGRLVEPFCGSAAVSIAAAARGVATKIWLNDLNAPLMALWTEILERPLELAATYEGLWHEQQGDRKAFFRQIRSEFNSSHQPAHLLYLLARIVKGSVRYSAAGVFNQSPDNRRSGMRPGAMRKQLLHVNQLLAGRTLASSRDFRTVVARTTTTDLIYMDPPYQGTSASRDRRYLSGLAYADFADALRDMNDNNLSYIVSYDGQMGDKAYGRPLPVDLRLKHLHIDAGRSTQSTLLGNNQHTVESLYISPTLAERLRDVKGQRKADVARQAVLFQ